MKFWSPNVMATYVNLHMQTCSHTYKYGYIYIQVYLIYIKRKKKNMVVLNF